MGTFYHRYGNDVMLPCPAPGIQNGTSGSFPLFPRNTENTKPMSQSTSDSKEMNPSAPRDSDYPPQLHAGAVGLGPEFGKGSVSTHYSLPPINLSLHTIHPYRP